MRQIHSSQELKNSVKDFYKTLFYDRQSNFGKPYKNLRLLEKKVASRPSHYTPVGTNPFGYVQKIRQNYQRILCADPAEIQVLMQEFEKLVPSSQMTKLFWEEIVDAMRYDALRDREFLKILNALKIKTCVYCHSQLTLTIEKTVATADDPANGVSMGDIVEWKGLLELDHKYPKSDYPFLCTSFYNLYPVCASCNKAKSDKPSDFFLYHDGPEFNLFRFALSDYSVVNYWANSDPEKIELIFRHINPGVAENVKMAEDYDKMFSITKIYNTQKDIIEELFHKQQVYTKEYNGTLLADFSDLFPDPGMLARLVIGTYENENDVFRRPMAKFIQDISRDIKLIDENGNLCQSQ